MVRRWPLPLLVLALVGAPALADPSTIHFTDPEGDVTVAGWRGAPLTAGTPCERTDIREVTIEPVTTGGSRAIVRVEDLSVACLGEHTPHQVYAVTLNLRLPNGSDAWAEGLYAAENGVLRALSGSAVRCTGSLVSGNCAWSSTPRPLLSLANSTVTLRTPFTLAEMYEVSVTTVMWECGGSSCVTGSSAGPGDRAPDVGGAGPVPPVS